MKFQIKVDNSLQRSRQIISGLDELLDWFRDVENQLRDAELPSAEPDILRMQLKEHKALNDSISHRKNQGRDVLTAAKQVTKRYIRGLKLFRSQNNVR